jgi:hypothetical protein
LEFSGSRETEAGSKTSSVFGLRSSLMYYFTIFDEILIYLRKSIKIKAYIILLAWLAIFVHNTIPHHHIFENVSGCHELIHNSVGGTDDTGKSSMFVSLPSEIHVCHISGFLFHSFNPENLITHPLKNIIFSCEVLKSPVVINTDQSYVSDHFHGSTSFRAPPPA